MGMVHIAGGEAVFSSMTVAENLALWSRQIPDSAKRQEKLALVYGTFSMLDERRDQRAGSLSGGQQQMLALAKAVMLEPQLLCIDELSLGLAPVVVQDILQIVERLKDQGITMIIVEQSLNVAMAIADRAVFMGADRSCLKVQRKTYSSAMTYCVPFSCQERGREFNDRSDIFWGHSA